MTRYKLSEGIVRICQWDNAKEHETGRFHHKPEGLCLFLMWCVLELVAKGGTGQIIGKRVNGEGNGKASKLGTSVKLGTGQRFP
jgi:hypothetical protein